MQNCLFDKEMLFLLFLSLIIVIPSVISIPHKHNRTKFSIPIERCDSGRACMNTCYYKGQQIHCAERNALKPVLFNPSFGKILPSVHLRFIQIENDEILNPDVLIVKENLTSYGMNIRFRLSTNPPIHTICADWLACSFEQN